jgi:hypothetical protein
VTRPVETKLVPCTMCSTEFEVRSVTSPHEEAPEMLQVPTGAWMGLVDDDGEINVVFCCSEPCVQKLLLEG